MIPRHELNLGIYNDSAWDERAAETKQKFNGKIVTAPRRFVNSCCWLDRHTSSPHSLSSGIAAKQSRFVSEYFCCYFVVVFCILFRIGRSGTVRSAKRRALNFWFQFMSISITISIFEISETKCRAWDDVDDDNLDKKYIWSIIY